MVNVKAILVCKKHPHYMAKRAPKVSCPYCGYIFEVVRIIQRHSKEYLLRYSA